MAKHKLLQGRKTGRLNTPPNVIKAANAKSNTRFKAATRPSTPSRNPSKITRSVPAKGGVAAGKFVTESRIRAHTRAKTSLLPGQNTTDKIKRRPSKFKLNAASIVTQALKAKVNTLEKTVQSKTAQIGRGGKLGSGTSTDAIKARATNLKGFGAFKKASIAAKSTPSPNPSASRKRKQPSPARKTIAQTGKSASNLKASDALAKRGTSGSSSLGLTDPIRKAGSNVAKANTRLPLSSTDTLKTSRTSKQTSPARKFIAQTGKAATAAKASAAITASAKGGTSTTRITARRTTNPNAANLALGKGQTTAKLSTGGAGKPPAPTPAGVEAEFKKGGQRATSRGQGTKGLNVGGMGRPGGTGGLRLFSPLGGPGGKDKFRQGGLFR